MENISNKSHEEKLNFKYLDYISKNDEQRKQKALNAIAYLHNSTCYLDIKL
ncbi:45724_t:CDS:2 [Gigaspora margarita]|uniref:45724_t:CDS:1 n=1 Tax=Gigaspora margarita TaxID=4874 RepID=A0ABM8VXW9_GIGMA|nr:45724_t:CDS:2 [Gigaspora margarita]